MQITKGKTGKGKTVKILEKGAFGIEGLKDKGRKLVFQDSKEDIESFFS